MTRSPLTPTRRPVPDDLFGGRLQDAYLLDLEVVGIDDIARRTRAVTFSSPDLVGFDHQAGQDLMMTFPLADRLARRRYTIRQSDPSAGSMVVEFVIHGHGPASDWAAGASVGDRIEAIGPRGTITIDADADFHVFIGDDSAVPATFAMIEALSPPATAAVILEVDEVASERPLPTTRAAATAHWVGLGEIPDAVGILDLPPGRGHAYVNGETGMVRAVRQALIDAGWPVEAISTKAYWRKGQANADHGEPARS